MCERMEEDLGLEYDRGDPLASGIAKVIVKEMVNLHWESLRYHVASLDIIDSISDGMFNTGLRHSLNADFGITVGFDRMLKARRTGRSRRIRAKLCRRRGRRGTSLRGRASPSVSPWS